MILEKKDDTKSLNLDEETTEDFLSTENIGPLLNNDVFLSNEVKDIKNKISRLLFSIMFRNLSPYRELFIGYYTEIRTEQFAKKIVFKLNKIVEKEIKLSKYKVYFINRENVKVIADDTYSLAFDVVIINNSGIVASWKQNFIYINILQSKLDFLPVNVIREAEDFLLSINKSMFYSDSNWKGHNLLTFIKGKLEEISLDFTISPKWPNMYLDLKSVDFYINIYWNNEWIFDLRLTENASYLYYFNKNNQKDQSRSNQAVPQNFKFKNNEALAYASAILSKMKEEFQDFWNVYDTVGEVIKTAKYLLYKTYGEMAKYIIITTNKTPKTKMIDILENDTPDFIWNILFFDNHHTFINNEYKFIKFKHVNMNKEIPTAISNININDSFPKKGVTLFNIIKYELIKLSYVFSIATKYDNLNSNQNLVDINLYVFVYFLIKTEFVILIYI